jgi:hypothetical protein
MKKLLLMLSAAVVTSVAANAQSRLCLYEEFSGENCGPCAAANPGLWTLLSGNTSKAILIKYQSPIPSAGPIYNQYKTVTDARLLYYSVPFAPYGRLNGTKLGSGTAAPSSPGHVANLTQTDIDNDYNAGSPFSMSITHTWNATGDSVTANVSITANSAFAPSGANLKLRIAIIEHLVYASAPGTNGEKDFHNVVREMVPNATGTQLPNSWTASQTQTYTIKGRVPAFVDKSNNEVRLVAWIQNDADKSIPQAAQSTFVPISLDAGSAGVSTPKDLVCTSSSTTVSPVVVLKNSGSTTLTSAKIYYRADNTAAQVFNWTGTLAPGATTNVTLTPGIALTPGNRTIIDSVVAPNGMTDINLGNALSATKVIVYNTTGNALPLSTGFENGGQLPTNWIIWDYDENGNVPVMGYSTSGAIGHANSTYTLWFRFPYEASGETNYVIMPQGTLPSGPKALDFWVAHALRTGANVDKLEVVYSTDCAANWTTVWSKTGTQLASAAPTANTTAYVPVQADWKKWSVDMSSVPANAMIALRGVGASGQNMFIDDVNLRTGPAGVGEIIANSQVSLYPNPAKESATLDFTLSKSGKVVVNVSDATGRIVAVAADATMAQGAQHITIPTAALAAGVYNISIQTEEGTLTQRLSVLK